MKRLALLILCGSCVCSAQQYTRGIGVYPGDPKEYTGPSLIVDSNYRNLALHRLAYQSSAYDYNLTAQLVTDGIKDNSLPRWIVTSTSDAGVLEKYRREFFLDGDTVTPINVSGNNPWVEFGMEGGGDLPDIDRIDIYLRRIPGTQPTGNWAYIVSGSDDNATWRELGRVSRSDWPDMNSPEPTFMQSIPFPAPAKNRYYRVQFVSAAAQTWSVGELIPFNKGQELEIAGPNHFTSAWMSAGSGEEWVYVDLGKPCTFDRIALSWIRRAAEGAIQVSNNATDWQTLQTLSPSAGLTDEIHLSQVANERYVRVLMTKPAQPDDHYILSELEVYGRGGLVAIPQPEPYPTLHSAKSGGALATSIALSEFALPLTGGNWRLERASQVPASGEQISTPGFGDKDWMIATVPGTVLTSYLNDEAIANPDFGDNQYLISDSFFCADFWYRDEFIGPGLGDGRHIWLDFDGINWKAEVYLNGHKVGRIDGGFMRGRFDVTALLHPGLGTNALAVRILRNDHPGSTKDKAGPTLNGGALGRDNPTYHASVGWDWISTIRGRDTGIWSNVSLHITNAVTVENPLVTTTLPLPDTTHADVKIQATLNNLENHPVSGVLRAQFGTIVVETPVNLDAASRKAVEFTPATFPALQLTNPKLWWPVDYGDPNLYPVTLSFIMRDTISDLKSFQAGIRQFTYSEDSGVLKIWINGRRFIPRGGNWGFPESMLRYRSREYETALRYHRDEHFNMIRDWVGQIGDEAFYEAADRNGVVVWQDFWLANPWDGPNPDDNDFFLANARDYLLRIRNHASLGLLCGRNEGFPPQPIDDGLRALVADLEPGSHYISSSADGPVSGHGPYRVEPLRYYFEHAPEKFHSEMGSPNIVDMDSLRRTLPESSMWPQNSQWPLHDFHPKNPFKDAIDQEYGGANNIADWVSLAQFVDYDAYRGMFEGQSKSRFGLLIWMSHPAWPSLLWQTYDYFFATDAGYYGAKKGAEPLHIQWNAATDAVEVVNLSAGDQPGLIAHAEVLNIDGSLKWEKSAQLDSHEDSTLSPFKLEFPTGLARTHFIRLTLSRAGKVVSSNFYLHGLAEEDFQGIRTLPRVQVDAKTSVSRSGPQWRITTELHNISTSPALMVRVKAVREKSNDPILPAIYDNNYIALMPGERSTIHVQLESADTRGERPRIVLEGFNLAPEK
jgi:Exo-beta-D-glucosaminidase Ig-fold domain/Glycosyl hydrolases family 2/F5/8 type C domain